MVKKNKSDSTKMITEFPRFMYKLNENSDDIARVICKINFSKNWITFQSEQEKLKPFIRTLTNQKGIIDYKKVIPHDNKILFESWKSEEYI